MPLYTKQSLENLRQRIDLVDVMSSHLELKRSGATYKGLCPFHDEKTPSLMIQKGDSHYHCFGCGAHGDAIQFLMNHLKMSFSESIEALAERYQIFLETVDAVDNQEVSKGELRAAVELANRFFQFQLFYTAEGHAALNYLYQRGLELDFIQAFQIGYAPKDSGALRTFMHAKFIKDDILLAAGLITETSTGKKRDFFSERITFPIKDPTGNVIGFSARKYKEETFGGKYINTSETPLFKKSKTLFGLNDCRRRITKERRVIIVEGQLDALKLIYHGLNLTVAALGTAFGEGHVKELLKLGIQQVILAMDADNAGQEAAQKVGHLFQREGVEVKVALLPAGADPDSFIKDFGLNPFCQLLETAEDFVSFLVRVHSRQHNLKSPAAKAQLVEILTQKIRDWEQPVLVHESLKRLADLLQISEELIGVNTLSSPNLFIKKSAQVGQLDVDPNKVLELDLLRWLVLFGNTHPQVFALTKTNLQVDDLKIEVCQKIYEQVLRSFQAGEKIEFLTLAAQVEHKDAQELLHEMMQKRVNRDRVEQQLEETIQKILNRNWMEKREQIKMKIQSGQCSDDEALELLKEFDTLKSNPPKLKS